MFIVKNAEENTDETYKQSSDVDAYIFVFLKNPKAGFLNEAFSRVSKRSTNHIASYS